MVVLYTSFDYDAFIAGHASNSISAALGADIGYRALEDKRRRVVAIIGDGAMTGGLAFEGLNNSNIKEAADGILNLYLRA